MKFSFRPTFLQFKHPFGVSSNTRTETPVVFVKLEHKDCIGYGEASLPPYLGESHESAVKFFTKVQNLLKIFSSPFPTNELLKEIDRVAQGNNAAKAAVDIAVHDLVAKLAGKPYYEMMGFVKPTPKNTSYTLGLGDENLIEQKIVEARDFSVLKLKLGRGNDKEIVETVRKFTDKPLTVDVNQGWTDKVFALEMIDWLSEKNVLFVEQPMPVNCKHEMEEVFQKSKIPLVADESIKRLTDIDQVIGHFHGINIKLMKSTGMRETNEMIRYAKSKGFKISLGCMGESSCAISAMAQFMDFADWLDLDGPLLLKEDPFSGIQYENGKVILSKNHGIGATPQMLIDF